MDQGTPNIDPRGDDAIASRPKIVQIENRMASKDIQKNYQINFGNLKEDHQENSKTDDKDNLCTTYDENFYRPYWEVEGWFEEGWRPMGRIREEEVRRQELQWRARKTF